MARRHVDALFSEAFDGTLDDVDRLRFDDHLAGCPECRDAFADYAAALQAVHELPPARMPVPVVIPATPPQVTVHPRPRRRILELIAGLLHPGPVAAGLGFAAAGILAVALVVHVGHGGGATSTPGSGAAALAPAPNGAAPGLNYGAEGASGPTRLTAPGCAFRVAAPAGGTTPEGFDHAVRRSDPTRPGQQLVLATSGSTVRAGDHVTVYARLVTAGADTAIVPCVSLVNGSATVPTLGPASAAGAAGAPAPVPAAPPAAAQPTTSGTADSAPLLSIDIPAGLASGTVLHVVAQVPAEVPDAANGSLQAVLTITVS